MISPIDKKELRFMNTPIRQFFQKHYEMHIFQQFLRKYKIDLRYKVILDAGCGSGYSTKLILENYQPKELFAFDLLPEQIRRAKMRKLPVSLFIGDITNITLPSKKFDAIFVFGILHHVPKWRQALKELQRLLNPQGILLIEEPNKPALDDAERFMKISHPQKSRFEWPEFIQGINDAGFQIIEKKSIYLNHFMSFICKKKK